MAVTSQARVDQPVRLFGCSHQGDQLPNQACPPGAAHLTAVSAVTWLGASAVHVNERYRVEKIDDNCGASPSVGNQLLVSLRLFFNRYTSVTSSCHDQAKATDLLDIRIGEWCVADTRTMICH